MTESPTRKSSPPIKVYCLPEEKLEIERRARAAGQSAAKYLREVGQSHEIRGVLDYEHVRELIRINGDLGRLGGLLKLWLTNDERVREFSPETIGKLLAKIEANQVALSTSISQVMATRNH